MNTFNNRIKQIRKDRNLTQKQTAEILNITERNYQYYESGQREPNLKTLVSIATEFDVSIDYLVGRTDNPEINK